jgi:hypothetical protein
MSRRLDGDVARQMAWNRWRKDGDHDELGRLDPGERAARSLQASMVATRRWETEKATWSPERLAVWERNRRRREIRAARLAKKAEEE